MCCMLMEEKHTQSQRLGVSEELGPQTYIRVGHYVYNSQMCTVTHCSGIIWDCKN